MLYWVLVEQAGHKHMSDEYKIPIYCYSIAEAHILGQPDNTRPPQGSHRTDQGWRKSSGQTLSSQHASYWSEYSTNLSAFRNCILTVPFVASDQNFFYQVSLIPVGTHIHILTHTSGGERSPLASLPPATLSHRLYDVAPCF